MEQEQTETGQQLVGGLAVSVSKHAAQGHFSCFNVTNGERDCSVRLEDIQLNCTSKV